MTDAADDALEEVLKLARDDTLTDDELRSAVRAILRRLDPEQRDLAIERARRIVAEQRPALH